MRTTCTWHHVMAMRKTITPFLSKERVLEVAAQGGTRTCGVVDLHDIITTMVACAHAEETIRKYDGHTYLAVVFCSDATIFNNASTTRCDVFVDLWEDRGAHHDGQAWVSWWVFDGGKIWLICKGWMMRGNSMTKSKSLRQRAAKKLGELQKKYCVLKAGMENS